MYEREAKKGKVATLAYNYIYPVPVQCKTTLQKRLHLYKMNAMASKMCWIRVKCAQNCEQYNYNWLSTWKHILCWHFVPTLIFIICTHTHTLPLFSSIVCLIIYVYYCKNLLVLCGTLSNKLREIKLVRGVCVCGLVQVFVQ